MGKTATLNIRVNPEVKENAESVLAQLGIPMATAIGFPCIFLFHDSDLHCQLGSVKNYLFLLF